ncbi:MAG: DUF488 domain-containing protein [Candidatus Babeliales bacterium]
MKKFKIFTIGHSTYDIKTFKKILKKYNIKQIIDIRSIPYSKHNPQFNFDTFSKTLRNSKFGYRHLKILGGLRYAKKDSINDAWINKSFRGFADYMQTKEFENGLKTLIKIAKRKRVAIMCSEILPWRCHRSLIGDALLIRGFDVKDIYNIKTCKPHEITKWAKVNGMQITYPKNKSILNF